MLDALRRRAAVHVGGLPPSYWYLWTGTLIDRLGSFVVPFLALYLTQKRGVSVAEASAIVALYGAGSIPASVVGGFLADRIGRRNTLVFSLALAGAGMLALGLVRDPRMLAPLACTVGFTSNLYRPAVGAAVTDLVPAADRVRAFSLLHWAVNIGFSIAPVVAGLVAQVSYPALFVADAATTFAYAVLVFVKVPEPVRGALSTGPGERAPTSPLRDPLFALFILVNFVFATVFAQGSFALPLDMQDHGVTPREFGTVIALNGVLIVLFQIPASRLLVKEKPERVLAAACVFMGAGFGLTSFVSTPLFYAGTVAVWTVGEILNSPVGPAVVSQLAPADQRGSYQGLYGTSWALAALAGPLVGGSLLEGPGAPLLWSGCALAGGATALGFLLLGRPLDRRLRTGASISS